MNIRDTAKRIDSDGKPIVYFFESIEGLGGLTPSKYAILKVGIELLFPRNCQPTGNQIAEELNKIARELRNHTIVTPNVEGWSDRFTDT